MSGSPPWWFVALQTAGIVGSLIFGAISLRRSARVAQASTLLQMNGHHRDIWKLAIDHPEFFELFADDRPDRPLSRSDRLFVNLVLLNASAAYRAVEVGALRPIEGMERDIGAVFNYPLVQSVWDDMKQYHDQDFIIWVEQCIDLVANDEAGR